MIKLQKLQKVVDQNTIVDVDALQVSAGELAALVGPTGSGKALLLQLLIGQEKPTVGSVHLAGVDPTGDRDTFTRRVGVMFAEDALYQRQSPQANLQFHCRLRGLPKETAVSTLAQVGLADHTHTAISKLPSGLKRRLSFGLAVLHQPDVLLLVDPFARCDEASLTLLAELIQAQATAGTAVLILADNDAHLNALCDTIFMLEKGRIADVYKPAEAAAQQETLPFKIPVRLEGSAGLVNPGDIYFAEVQDGRTYLQTADGRPPTQFTMTDLEQRLARSGFFRAHRGYLVNLQHVKEVIPYTRSSFSLKLNDVGQTKIPLSKDAARELRELLGY